MPSLRLALVCMREREVEKGNEKSPVCVCVRVCVREFVFVCVYLSLARERASERAISLSKMHHHHS